MKLTPAQRAALAEINDAGPAGLKFYTFTQALRRRLIAFGLILCGGNSPTRGERRLKVANGKVHPSLCAHPLTMVQRHPTLVGKCICTSCGTVGTIMTKGPGGLLLPKLEVGKVSQ